MAGLADYLAVLQTINQMPGGNNLGPLAPQPGPTPMPVSMAIGPAPEPAPPAPAVPLDQGTIGRYLAQAGPEPVRPTIAPASALERVAAALQGFSAGVQGRGGEFVSNLKAERDRLIREYEAQRQEYLNRRSQLGLIGTQAAERQSERAQARSQEVADKNADREFQTWLRRAQITDEQAIQQARQAFDLQKIREQERIADERLQLQQKAQQQKDARAFASAYRKAGAGKFAKELGDYDAGLTETLSPEAAKWESAQARLAEIRANRAAGGGAGGGTTERTVVELVGPDGNVLGQMRYGELRFDQGAPAGFPPGTQVRLQGQATAPTTVPPSPFPSSLGFPELTPQAAAPQMSRAQSKRKLVKAGYSSAEADQQLDRLGIR